MDQIVRRKKKGRPSKADLAVVLAGSSTSQPTQENRDIRRSLRRRSFRYSIIDYDEDYLEDDFEVAEEEDDEDEDERGRGKKLKLVLKLPNHNSSRPSRDGGDSVTWTRRQSKGAAGSDEDAEEHDEDEEEEEDRVVKKRNINGCDDDNEDDDDNDNDEERRGKGDLKSVDYVPGTTAATQSGTPLPEKKQLELVLDKLQKKDTYGVYAEPVDPEELPDYHDIIENPMDFATVRKKLANGSYSTLEQFEADVFLICSNAMHYNAPETIYYKQARTIKELAEKKIQQIRNDIERSRKEPKSEQKTCTFIKKQTKKPICRSMHEPVESDFSSGATLATVDVQNTSNAVQASNCDKPGNNDGIVDGSSSLLGNNVEKSDDLQSGKYLLPKFGKKPSVVDENRRCNVDTSNQPVDISESIFMTFEGEKKHLVSVGLQGEHSYALSLAHFAATLGPVAWRIASKRIEQSIPPGVKFGRGWVGEYEPLPTPVIVLRSQTQNEDPFSRNLQSPADFNDDKFPQTSVPLGNHLLPANGLNSEGKSPFLGSQGSKPPTPKSALNQLRNPFSGSAVVPENTVLKKEESNCPATANQNTDYSVRKLPCGAEMPTSGPGETMTRKTTLLPSLPFKQPESYGVSFSGIPGGKIINNSADMDQMISSFPHRKQEQSLNDQVQVMRTLTEQKQQNGSNHPLGPTHIRPSARSPRGDNRHNAATASAAASAAASSSVWMSVGVGGFKPATENPSTNRSQISSDSLYNNTARDLHAQFLKSRGETPISGTIQFRPEKKSLPFQAFVPQPVKVFNEVHFENNQSVVFPQFATTDLSRFQGQSPWQGLSPHTQQRQKPEKLPPDLNIAFQSSVDSQQPDLALQL
ncbi:hypothetical protein Nepgr_027348 [Nepenthes gracilis]|uniref:Bromo domain-containing protein n=1 Tax=Nepenthes gracilis TaxID=150966 RepID=A0AAD3T8E7_NEPGR|nr:hypothetical protein Nepgr_027348 [Nepenthes gracilis]